MHPTGPEQVAGLAAERPAELSERAKGHVLAGALQAVEGGAAQPEHPRHLALGDSGLPPHAQKGLPQRPSQVHGEHSCAVKCSHVNIPPVPVLRIRKWTVTSPRGREEKAFMGRRDVESRTAKEIRGRLQAIYEGMTRATATELWDEAATLVESLPPGSRARREVQWLMDAIKEKAKALR